jgi:hypothetical protein
VCELVAALADALQFAHQNGIIHRDVKPRNILVDRDGAPHLADFGLAKDIEDDSLSGTGDIIGTLPYMSPEQAAAKRAPIDQRTDVYSLGVVLYELLTLRRPFDGDSVHEIVMKITLRDPARVRSLNRAVPRDLETICIKAMEKVPARRYSSAGELAADLRRFLAHESIIARPPSLLEIGRRRVQRHKVLVALVVVAVVAALSSAAVTAANNLERQLEPLRALAKEPDLALVDAQRLAKEVEDARKLLKQKGTSLGADQALLAVLVERIEQLGKEWKKHGLAERARFCDPGAAPLVGPVGPAGGPDAYWSMEQAIARLRDASMLLPLDDELKRFADVRSSLPRIRVTCDQVGARVRLRRIEPDGSIGALQELGAVPIDDLSVPPGFYRIVVEKPEVGFAELTRYLDRPGRLYDLRARIRPTASVVAEQMASIPAGEAWFGDSTPHSDAIVARRRVHSHAFWIDLAEVSNAQYRAFLQDSGYPPPAFLERQLRRQLGRAAHHERHVGRCARVRRVGGQALAFALRVGARRARSRGLAVSVGQRGYRPRVARIARKALGLRRARARIARELPLVGAPRDGRTRRRQCGRTAAHARQRPRVVREHVRERSRRRAALATRQTVLARRSVELEDGRDAREARRDELEHARKRHRIPLREKRPGPRTLNCERRTAPKERA